MKAVNRFVSFFRCCTNGNEPNGDQYLQPLNLFNPRSGVSVEDLVEQSSAAREKLWSSLGTLEPFALSQNLSAAAATGPKWPALQQSFRLIHRPNGSVLLVSDGLSDPFDDVQESGGNVNGYSLEFFIETPASELGTSPADVKASWQFQLLFTVSQLAAGHGSIRSIIDDMELLSTEAEGVAEAVPEAARGAHVNRAGRVGALLGLHDPSMGIPAFIPNMPLTDVRLVNIKLISLAELKLITDRGAHGRRRLAELFAAQPGALVSSLERPSVL
ncbi:hypothetical protein ACKKBF_B36065 [Auxenochlorella protothecoides x Auxenochlorella symbiontica]